MQITIKGDSNGFMLMHCKDCNNDFKLCIEEYKTLEINKLTCPYCGLTKNNQEFLPKKIIDDAMEMVQIDYMHQLQEMLSKTFKNSKLIKYKPSKIPARIENKDIETNETIDSEHMCLHCGKVIRVVNTSKSAKIYCSYCGELI